MAHVTPGRAGTTGRRRRPGRGRGARVASSRDRQRKLARAKLDRQMARRAAARGASGRSRPGRRRLSLVLVVARRRPGRSAASTRDPKQTRPPRTLRLDAAGRDGQHQPQGRRHAGHQDLPTDGTRTMTIDHQPGRADHGRTGPDQGARARRRASPTWPSQSFYDNTKCHEITTEGAAALRRPVRHRPRRADLLVLRRERADRRRRPSPVGQPGPRPDRRPYPTRHGGDDRQPAGQPTAASS